MVKNFFEACLACIIGVALLAGIAFIVGFLSRYTPPTKENLDAEVFTVFAIFVFIVGSLFFSDDD